MHSSSSINNEGRPLLPTLVKYVLINNPPAKNMPYHVSTCVINETEEQTESSQRGAKSCCCLFSLFLFPSHSKRREDLGSKIKVMKLKIRCSRCHHRPFVGKWKMNRYTRQLKFLYIFLYCLMLCQSLINPCLTTPTIFSHQADTNPHPPQILWVTWVLFFFFIYIHNFTATPWETSSVDSSTDKNLLFQYHGHYRIIKTCFTARTENLHTNFRAVGKQ